MNIAICDDEENVRVYIRKLIEDQNRSCRILEFTSGSELLLFWDQKTREEIDILFLDISMKGMDGMSAAEQIRKGMEDREETIWGSLPLLIFVTGYPEYMSKAFGVNAYQYLVKPIDEKEFAQVFKKAMGECRRLSEKKASEPREILVKNGNTTRAVRTDDIYYIESYNRKIILHMEKEKIDCYGKIGEWERQLPAGFFRIHRGYLLNMKYVERYDRTQVRLKSGENLLISKYKYQDFVKAYLDYISEEG